MAGIGAMLLCAGKGTRLMPLTEVFPKCLMPINGRPLLGYWLEVLAGAGVERILVNLHHHADLVRDYIDGSPFAGRVSTVHEPALLGTGGTLLANRHFFEGGTVLLAHGDNLTTFDPARMLRAHESRPAGCELTMMTFVTPDPRSCGIIEADPRGVVLAFHEKVAEPPGNLANGAVYLVAPSMFDFLQATGKRVIDFSNEVLPHFMGRVFTYHNADYHRDIGTPQSLVVAQFEHALAGRGGTPDAFYKRHGERTHRFIELLQATIGA
jgi:mannose-1-phosphate guanylyltransferase